MSEVNETRFLIQHESCECKCRLNESIYNSKKKRIMNVAMSVKNQMIGIIVKMVIRGILARAIVNIVYSKRSRIGEHLDIKSVYAKNVSLVNYYQHVRMKLEYNKNSLDNKKVTCKKNIVLFALFHW